METKDLLLEFKYKKLISYLRNLIRDESYVNTEKIQFIIDLLESEEE